MEGATRSTSRARLGGFRAAVLGPMGIDLLAVGLLVLVGVGIPVGLAMAAGAVGIPSNDDWVYMRAASTFRDGHVEVATRLASFVVQLLLVQPLLAVSAGERWAFTAFGVIASVAALTIAYLLARRFLAPRRALAAAALLAVYPAFLRTTTTFMTDIPALTFTLLSLLLGTLALERPGGDGEESTARPDVALAVSVLSGILGFGIREFSIAAPVAVLVIASIQVSRRRRPAMAASWLMLVLGAVAMLAAADVLAPGPRAPSSMNLVALTDVAPLGATLAAAVLPLLVLASAARWTAWSGRAVLLAMVVTALACSIARTVILPNLWSADGAMGNAVLAGTRAQVLHPRLWGLSEQLAILALTVGVLLVGSAARNAAADPMLLGRVQAWAVRKQHWRGAVMTWARHPLALLVLFVLIEAAGLVVVAVLTTMLDRYLFALVPVTAIVVTSAIPAGRPPIRVRLGAATIGVWLAASSLALTLNSFAYDSARWRAGEALVASGDLPASIDAGYEWVGFHAPLPSASSLASGVADDATAGSGICVVVSNLEDADPASAVVARYRTFLFAGPLNSLVATPTGADCH